LSSRVEILGGFRLSQGAETVRVSTSAERLIAFLAVHNRPVSRLYVASSLYLELTDARAAANLRSILWRLRSEGLRVVEVDGAEIRLTGGVTTDLGDALALATQILADDSAVESDFAPFLTDILPDWYDDWLVFERDRYRQLRHLVLELLCRRLAARADFSHAVTAGLAAVEIDPLSESAQGALIEAYLAEGNCASALRQYQCFSRALAEDLGLEPSPCLRRLFGDVLEPLTRT
jgi:DNA-binding SARP family transcriptional activator